MNRFRLAALLLFIVLVLPLLAADTSSEDLEHNARLLQTWKTDPEHYARLQRDGSQFVALATDKQEKLRQFDRELHEEYDPETQYRLWASLERYVVWLDQLPEADRQQILSITDKQERIKTIKLKREQQWLARLPAKEREELEKLSDDERPTAIARLYQQELQRRQKWLVALKLRPDLRPRPNRAKKLEEFPAEVTTFVNGSLLPMLHYEEKEKLSKAQEWPLLALMILELSEKHPVLLPANGQGQIKDFRQLPAETKQSLQKQGKSLEKHKDSGRWPDYALAVTELAARHNHVIKPLGACKPAEFPTDTEAFIKDELIPVLTAGEMEHLRQTEGQWPAYPKLLHELAKKYNLVIPGMSLPGPRELWESARTAGLPELPDHELRAFVCELSHEDLGKLNLSPLDPSSRDRLRQEYFRRHPGELKRLRDLEQRKSEKKATL
jgi:hypothetical protein